MDPLAIIAYGIGIFPLINSIRREIPDVTQPWYADISGALSTFERLETYFDSLTRQGPGWGYHPKPSKSLLIVSLENFEAGKVFVRHHGLKVYTAAHYRWGYIGDDESKRYWMRELTLMWENKISTISETTEKYPQESYAIVVRAIQPE